MTMRPSSFLSLISLLFSALPAFATDGWTLPPRPITGLPDDSKAWIAPVEKGAEAFEILLHGGAEGSVSFEGDAIRVDKTNGDGTMWIVAREPFHQVSKDLRYRISAEMEARCAQPCDALANVRVRRVDAVNAGAHQANNRADKHDRLVCTAPGRPVLKANPLSLPAGDAAAWRLAICVEGSPSVTVWRNLRADSMAEVEKAEAAARVGHEAHDFIGDLTDSNAFDAKLAADFEHTAKVVKEDGYARLLVDGRPIPPFIFKGGHARTRDLQFGGKRMHEAGIPLLAAQVWPGSRCNGGGYWPSYWTTNGFDVAKAVADVKRSMLTAPDALYFLTIHVNAPAFWGDAHTNEIWRSETGEPIYGNDAHALGPASPDGKPTAKWHPYLSEGSGMNAWPWPSMHSRVLRDETKAMLSTLIAELKRTGISKRIVGVHLGGYHDAQFTPAIPDFSEPARRAFAASGETNYVAFLKRQPMELQEDLARHVREAFGKELVMTRWCMAAFGPTFTSSHDIREFCDSKEIDAIAPQVGYGERTPGFPVGVKSPCASFHYNGKMLIHELDLRTYVTWPVKEEAWRRVDLSRAEDIDEWRSIDRKVTGQMIARRMGFWWYDFDKGSFDLPEIAEDMADIVRSTGPLYLETPDPWRPTAAFVIDEADLLALQCADGKCEKAKTDINAYISRLAESGVPFDVWMKGDMDRKPELTDDYRYIIHYDRNAPPRTAAEINGEARAAGAYVPLPPGVVQVDMNGDFVSLHCLVPGRYDFLLPRECVVVNLKSGERERTEGMVLPVEMTAGETCWFRLLK